MSNNTYCVKCQNVVLSSRKLKQYNWLCSKHKNIEGRGFVDPDVWAKSEPYLKCKDVNGGDCPLYEEIERKDDV